MRGYFGIGIENPNREENIGTLWRAAYSFGAQYIFTIGRKYIRQKSDTSASYKQIPLFNYQNIDHFLSCRPTESVLVGVETGERSRDIKNFIHPERSIYVLGNEKNGLSSEIIQKCNVLVRLPGLICHNVSLSGGLVMFDRKQKDET